MTRKDSYEKKIVFFIDILGFKSIVQGDEAKDPQEIKTIFNRIKTKLDNNHFSDIPESKRVIHFSDSIIISFDYKDASSLYWTIKDILNLQKSLIKEHQMLIRGACEIGDLIHQKDVVFGSALNKAYELEDKCANYPRIIISDDIIKQCALHSNNCDKEKNIKSLLKKDTDGYYYVNYFNHIDNNFDTDYKSTLKNLIARNISSNNVSIKQKYLWMKDKYKKQFNEDIEEIR